MNRAFGKQSEDMAVEFLVYNGFRIIERNFYASRFGEIDIIALKDNILHFIEVKSSYGSFEPIYNITPVKINKIIKSVYYYLKVKKLSYPWCIDALIIKDREVELIENITL